jgi:hypothetical protein
MRSLLKTITMVLIPIRQEHHKYFGTEARLGDYPMSELYDYIRESGCNGR